MQSNNKWYMSFAQIRENATFVKVDALPNILRSHHVAFSIIWTILLLASASVCTVFITATFAEYSEHKVTTTTRLFSEQMPVFPTVTFCQMNAFRSDYGVDMLRAAKATYLVDGEPDNNYLAYLRVQAYVNETRGSLMTDKEKFMLGGSLDTVLVSCTFQGVPCNSSNFTFMFHPYYLGCFRFNADASRLSYAAGYDNGLVLRLYTGVPDSLTANVFSRGLFVMIQNASDYSLSQVPTPYVVMPGIGVHFILSRTFFKAHPMPYSDCSVGEDNELLVDTKFESDLLSTPSLLFDSFKNKEFAYAQSDCFRFCQQLGVIKLCNCTSFKIDFAWQNVSVCLSAYASWCSEVSIAYFQSTNLVQTYCMNLCPLECQRQVFTVTPNTFKFPPSDSFVRHIKQRVSRPFSNQSDFVNDLTNNIAQFAIYYDTLSYTLIEEEPKMSFDVLLGTLGGHLHLFMGMSLISFIEVAELAAMLLLSVISKSHEALFEKKKTKIRKINIIF